MKLLTNALCALVGLAAFGNVDAHHSFAAIWDETQEFQIRGVLSKVEWINPHSYFEVDVTNEDGTVDTYSFENFPPLMLRGLGMTREMMVSKIGQEVTVAYNPAQNGTKTLGYGRVFEFADGPKIIFTGPTAGITE